MQHQPNQPPLIRAFQSSVEVSTHVKLEEGT
jgi:hypothetical protein